jgi:hypothetical protein
MGAVDLAPLLGQLQDLLDLLLQQAVDRATTGGPILQRASHSPGLPAAHPPLGHLQHSAAALHGEPSVTAWSTSSSSAALVAAATRGGTPPINPSAIFPAAASARSPAP